MRRNLWVPLAALLCEWLWTYMAREHPELPMFGPSRAARLLSEHDHRILFGRVTK